jgi:hypothetical protein
MQKNWGLEYAHFWVNTSLVTNMLECLLDELDDISTRFHVRIATVVHLPECISVYDYHPPFDARLVHSLPLSTPFLSRVGRGIDAIS